MSHLLFDSKGEEKPETSVTAGGINREFLVEAVSADFNRAYKKVFTATGDVDQAIKAARDNCDAMFGQRMKEAANGQKHIKETKKTDNACGVQCAVTDGN